jgi:hypothetical protein
MAGPRPAHQIIPAEVDVWLADSVVKAVTYHRTDAISARGIIARGVDLAEADLAGAWGRGFYSSTVPDPQYGSIEIAVAAPLRVPLVIRDTVREAERVDRLLLQAGTDDFREAFLGAGYDGAVIHYPWGITWVVAYFSHQVRVVVGASEHE